MEHRPRQLVLFSLLFCLSPFLYPFAAALHFGTSAFEILGQTFQSNSLLRNFETFLLPPILGFCIFFARRSTYFAFLVGAVYLIIRSFLIFVSSNEADPVAVLVLMNLFLISVILVLSRRTTRMIYFNPKVRWWETDPRYVVEFDGKLTRLGRPATKVRIRNIAVGGAAIELDEAGFAAHEVVILEFHRSGVDYRIIAEVVWEQGRTSASLCAGLQWSKELLGQNQAKIRTLIQDLKASDTPTTRKTRPWSDLRGWLGRTSA